MRMVLLLHINLNPTGGDSQYISTCIEVRSDPHQTHLLLIPPPIPPPTSSPRRKPWPVREGMRKRGWGRTTINTYGTHSGHPGPPCNRAHANAPPGIVLHVTVLIFIPAGNIEGGRGAILLMERIASSPGHIQLTLPHYLLPLEYIPIGLGQIWLIVLGIESEINFYACKT